MQDWKTIVAGVVFYLSAISSMLRLAAITVPRYGLKVVISLQSEITAKQGEIKSWTTRKEKEDPSTQTKDVSARKTEAKRATFTYFVSRAGMIVIFRLHCPILLPSRVLRVKAMVP